MRFDAGPRLEGDALRDAARQRLRFHLDQVPPGNPFERFGTRLADDLPSLLAGDEAGYHAYAFATVRMAGAGFELCAAHIDWVLGDAGARASAAMAEIVEGSKLLGFKLARRRPFDPSEGIGTLVAAWDRALGVLDDVVR